MPIHTRQSRRRTGRFVKRAGRAFWETAGVAVASIPQGNSSISNLLGAVSEDFRRGLKIVRVIGSWASRPETNDVDGGIALCFYIQSLEGFAAAIIPEYLLDNYRYLWQDVMSMHTGDVLNVGESYQTHQIDFRPNRVLKGDETIVALRENISTDVCSIAGWFNLRILLSK